MSETIFRDFAPPSAKASERYWEREKSAAGRVINDVIDRAREAGAYVRMMTSRPSDYERQAFSDAIQYDRLEKEEWRHEFRETGKLVTPNERLNDLMGWDPYDNEPSKIATVIRGEWKSDDYGRETRTEIGRSDEGFHYMNHVSEHNRENDPAWSKAFKTQDLAERVASAQLHAGDGIGLEGRRRVVADAVARAEHAPMRPDAERAHRLNVSAHAREMRHYLGPREPFAQSDLVRQAKEHVERARAVPATGFAKIEQTISQAKRDAARAIASSASVQRMDQQTAVQRTMRQ